jgi:hypothetical protein
MELAMNEVASQLLTYPFQQSERKGVREAIQIARQWLEEIFKEPWWPGYAVRPLVHDGDNASCDAVKFTYRASDTEGALAITVFQTLFFIVVTVANGPAGKLNALDVARRLFNYTERLNLTAATETTGHQVSDGVSFRDNDWLDTIQWWSDEKLVGFEILKRTGPGRGTIVRPELEGNRNWFARLV